MEKKNESIALNSDALSEVLQEQGIETKIDAETGQVLFNIPYEDKVQCPTFIRVYPGGQLLQMMMFFPMVMKPKTQGDTARLLHFFNRELDIPGFGMDEESGVCFFRCMIPSLDAHLPKQIIIGYLGTLKTVCKSFIAPIGVITSGTSTFEALLSQAKEKSKEMATKKEPEFKKV